MIDLERLKEALRVAFLRIGIYRKSDMAEYLGYNSPYFSGVINGKEKMTEPFLKNISEKLGVNKDWLINGDGEMLLTPSVSETETGNMIIPKDNTGTGNVSDLSRALEEIGKLTAALTENLSKKDGQIDRLLTIIENMNNK